MDLETERLARGLPRDMSPSSPSPSSCRTFSTDSRSSTSTKLSSRGSSPAVQKESKSRANGRGRRNSNPSAPAWNLMFHPRSYEEIFTERAYLTASLQACSIRTVDLIHQYSLIEEELQVNDYVGKQRRKLRKQMSFIKAKLADASRQEKALLVRLSELQMEQLRRDAWDQVQARRLFYPAFLSSTKAPPSVSSETLLSATSHEFAPSTVRPGSPLAHAEQTTPDMDKPRVLETVVEAMEGEEDDEVSHDGGKKCDDEPETDIESEDLCNHGLEYTYKGCGTAQERPAHLRERLLACDEEKRMSLPSLCSIWPSA